MLELYLIRHAQSESNLQLKHRIGGRAPASPITAHGAKQAQRLSQRLAEQELHFDHFFCSDAVRTQQTAYWLKRSLPSHEAELEVCPEITEISMGVWEGQPREHIYQMHVLQQIKEDPWNFAPPGGESQRQVEERMMSWLEQRVLTLKKSNGDPTRVLAVSHGLALKCLLRGIMGFSPQHAFRATLGNTGIIQLKHSTQGWHLIRFNDTAHLVHDAPLAQ